MMPLACVCEEFFVPSPQDHFVFKEHFYMLRISSMYTMCSDHVQPSFLSPNSPRHLHRAPAPTSTAPFVLNPTTPYLLLFACTQLHGCEIILWSMENLPVAPTLQKADSQSLSHNSLHVRVRARELLPLCWNFECLDRVLLSTAL